MPSWRAIGNRSGASSTRAGTPSSTLPRMTKTTMLSAMKPAAPPGILAINSASSREKPDGKQRRDRDTGDRADDDQHDARGDRFRHRAGGREQRNELAGFHHARLH